MRIASSYPYHTCSVLDFREYEVVIRSLVDAYSRAEHWSTKRQLLSIVAADLPARLLKTEFPELTDWKIKAARSQAFFQGSVQVSTRVRVSLVNFIFYLRRTRYHSGHETQAC